jgi:hypothetical protein
VFLICCDGAGRDVMWFDVVLLGNMLLRRISCCGCRVSSVGVSYYASTSLGPRRCKLDPAGCTEPCPVQAGVEQGAYVELGPASDGG